MTPTRKWLATTVAALASLTTVATLATAQQTSLRYTTGAPPKTPWVMQAERFAKALAEESKDTIKLELFIAAQLGNEQDTLQQVVRGRIDMGGFSTTAGALIVQEFSLFNLPFYFASVGEQDCTLDQLVPDMRAMLDAKGVRFLGWSEVGTADLVGKKPLLSPTDARGIKAAANPHKISALMWSTLGANANVLGITEIVGAFQTGLVEAQSQVVTFYVPSGLSKVAPVLTRINLSNTPGLVLINKATYEKLSAEQKTALDSASSKTPVAQIRQEVRGFEQTLRNMHVQAGGQVVETSPAQRDAWRAALRPAWPEMVKAVNGAEFFAKMDAAKGKCAGK